MIVVRAPSNIALIKYMGKSDSFQNQSANPSLSMTLDGFSTWVEMREPHESVSDFKALSDAIVLNEHENKKVTLHFDYLRKKAPDVFREFGLIPLKPWDTQFEVRSANTFPTACGVASSASSFAAYTFGFFVFFGGAPFLRLWHSRNQNLYKILGALSQKGSGSSCRSFLGPWVSWTEQGISNEKSSLPHMVDLLLVVSKDKKKISSSEAHQRVVTSPLWGVRQQNVKTRYKELLEALKSSDFINLKKLVWDDFMEMHELFHTAQNSFSYFTDETKKVLSFFESIDLQDRPIVTMDAGPNIHVLIPSDEVLFWELKIKQAFPDLEILSDQQGNGPLVVLNNESGFKTKAPGKWILSGEHTVLRGGTAIAIPHADFYLTLQFKPEKSNSLKVEPQDIEKTVYSSLDCAREYLSSKGITYEAPKGVLKIESTIPLGAGLGSSAAFCVALARFILSQISVQTKLPSEIELAQVLEHQFHGKSSGLDVAVVSIEKPIQFSMQNGAQLLNVSNFPRFEFIDTGLRSSTRDCVLKVEQKRKSNEALARQWDEQMQLATIEITQGLESQNKGLVAQGMRRSFQIFDEWGLVPTKVHEMSKQIETNGSLACRLTGAGNGGFLVALQ